MNLAKTLYAVDRDAQPYSLAESETPDCARSLTAFVMACEPHRLTVRDPTDRERGLFQARSSRFGACFTLAVMRTDGILQGDGEPLLRGVRNTAAETPVRLIAS